MFNTWRPFSLVLPSGAQFSDNSFIFYVTTNSRFNIFADLLKSAERGEVEKPAERHICKTTTGCLALRLACHWHVDDDIGLTHKATRFNPAWSSLRVWILIHGGFCEPLGAAASADGTQFRGDAKRSRLNDRANVEKV